MADVQFLLLADLDDWLKLLIIVVPLVFTALSTIFKKVEEAKKAAPRRPVPQVPAPRPEMVRPVAAGGMERRGNSQAQPGRAPAASPPQPVVRQQRPAPAAAQQRPQGKPGDPLAREIEEFLRRATAKKQDAEQRKPPPKQPAGQPARPVKTVGQRMEPRPTKKVQEPARPESVAEHVRRNVSTEDVVAHSKSLGSDLRKREEELERGIKKKFEHHVGKLAVGKGTTGGNEENPEKREPIAHQIAGMIRNPRDVRKAIVLSMILERPETGR